MARAAQIKALIKSHYDNDHTRFDTLSLQLAAHEAMIGNNSLALEVKRLVDTAKKHRILDVSKANNHSLSNNVLGDLLLCSKPALHIDDIILQDNNKEKIFKILNEYNNQEKIKKYGLNYRRKILLAGYPGTGKTMTASIIASVLHLPLYTIQIDKTITKFMGETSAKLRQIFKMIEMQKGVYFFDEFDSIGTDRGKDNEVGEIRRVLNSFLQFLENDCSDSLIIAATNNISLLDKALFRRFDDILYYDLPTQSEIVQLMKLRLRAFKIKFSFEKMALLALGLNHADIAKSCDNTIKETIIHDEKFISKKTLTENLNLINESYRKMKDL